MICRCVLLFFGLIILSITGCTSGNAEPLPTLSPTDGRILATRTLTEQKATPTSTEPGVSPEAEVSQDQEDDRPDLAGRITFIGFDKYVTQIVSLDLETETEKVIYTSPEGAWLSELALSPDGNELLLAYSPPPEEGQVQTGFTDLYRMPADGSSDPVLLLEGQDPSESLFNISWPVDDIIYYAHFIPSISEDGLISYGSQVERLNLEEGVPEVLVNGAAWPRVSGDGETLAYVTEENDLMVAQSNGSIPKQLLAPDTFAAVDAPLFSPDKQAICFSAVEQEPGSTISFVGRILGLKTALAHNVPSDWWCLSLNQDGEPWRLTELDGIGFYGDFTGDGKDLVFMTTAGLYAVTIDGSGLRQLLERPLAGTLSWSP